jgi:hypothetical protein
MNDQRWVFFDGQFGPFPVNANQVATVFKKHLKHVDPKYMDATDRPDLADVVLLFSSGYELVLLEKDLNAVCEKLGIDVPKEQP